MAATLQEGNIGAWFVVVAEDRLIGMAYTNVSTGRHHNLFEYAAQPALPAIMTDVIGLSIFLSVDHTDQGEVARFTNDAKETYPNDQYVQGLTPNSMSTLFNSVTYLGCFCLSGSDGSDDPNNDKKDPKDGAESPNGEKQSKDSGGSDGSDSDSDPDSSTGSSEDDESSDDESSDDSSDESDGSSTDSSEEEDSDGSSTDSSSDQDD